MSTRVVGRGRCPKCGREGSVVLKEISGRVYVYFKHGRDWCYIGPLDKVDLSKLITELSVSPYHNITTKLGGSIKDLVHKLSEKSLKHVVVEVVAIALIVFGALIALNTILAFLGAITSIGSTVSASEERPVGRGDAFIVNVGNDSLTTITVECINCMFKTGNVTALKLSENEVQSICGLSPIFCKINSLMNILGIQLANITVSACRGNAC